MSGFGGINTAPAQTTGFGTAPAGGFGAGPIGGFGSTTTGFGVTQPQNTGGFGTTPASGFGAQATGFGTTPSMAPAGGFGTTTGFGAPAATTGFGTGTGTTGFGTGAPATQMSQTRPAVPITPQTVARDAGPIVGPQLLSLYRLISEYSAKLSDCEAKTTELAGTISDIHAELDKTRHCVRVGKSTATDGALAITKQKDTAKFLKDVQSAATALAAGKASYAESGTLTAFWSRADQTLRERADSLADQARKAVDNYSQTNPCPISQVQQALSAALSMESTATCVTAGRIECLRDRMASAKAK